MCCWLTVGWDGGPDSAAAAPDHQSPHPGGAPADATKDISFKLKK